MLKTKRMHPVKMLGCGPLSLAVLLLACMIATTAGPAAAAELEWRDGEWVAATQPASGTAEGDLAIIRARYQNNRNRQAIKATKKFLDRYPFETEREEAMHIAACAERARGRRYQAYEWLERQLTAFPNGSMFEQAVQMEHAIAEELLQGRRRIVLGFLPIRAYDDGVRIMEGIAEHAPATPLAEKSLLRVGDFHQSRQDYEDATTAYDVYLTMFPKSAKSSSAALQAAWCSLLSYRGTNYDATPVLEAEQRFRNVQERWPQAAAEANTDATLARISEVQAKEDFSTAKFYLRVKKPDAAAFYYRQIVQRHDASSYAELARGELERMNQPIDAPPARKLRRTPLTNSPAPAVQQAGDEPTQLETLVGDGAEDQDK